MLAERLKTIREQRGMTQYALARESGLTASYIYKLEEGQATRPSGQTLERLARALEVSIAELTAEDVWDTAPGTDETERDLSRRVIPLLRRMKLQDPEEFLRQFA